MRKVEKYVVSVQPRFSIEMCMTAYCLSAMMQDGTLCIYANIPSERVPELEYPHAFHIVNTNAEIERHWVFIATLNHDGTVFHLFKEP